MQIKFFDDNIFCELYEVSQGKYKCSVCGTEFIVSDKHDQTQIKMPCHKKIQNSVLEIDSKYRPEPIKVVYKQPNIFIKTYNFLKASVKHILSGARRTSTTERNKRYAICQSCEFFDGSACMQCGCPISRQARFISKLDWSDQHCPINKW